MYEINYKGKTLRERIQSEQAAKELAQIYSLEYQLDRNEMQIVEYCDVDLSMYGF